MSEQVNIHEAKSRLSNLIARAEMGEEIIIARANKPAVRLVPIRKTAVQRKLGEAKGKVKISQDFNDLPDELMEHFK